MNMVSGIFITLLQGLTSAFSRVAMHILTTKGNTQSMFSTLSLIISTFQLREKQTCVGQSINNPSKHISLKGH